MCVCVCVHMDVPAVPGGAVHWHTVGQKTTVKGKVDLWRCLKVGSPLKGGGRQREEWEENIVQFLPFQSFELT